MANRDPKEDVLKDKVFTKTAFAVRIDTLEAGIKWERQARSQMQSQLNDMAKQFQLMSVSISKLTSVSELEAGQFWQVFLKYMPKEYIEKLMCVDEGGKPSKIFINGLVQALRVYGMTKIGDINGKGKT